MKTIRLILTFYSNFFLASIAITLCCASLLYLSGIYTFVFLFWFKLITLCVTFFFIKERKEREFYYFQNLGISRIFLWATTLFLDLFLFFLILLLTYNIL